jgi:cobalt/nickel transport system permease protein
MVGDGAIRGNVLRQSTPAVMQAGTMHIPDGYLSPSTCAAGYALAAGGWYAALKRIRRVLFTRAIPLISVFAAFCFVLMMFNLPLPGGTTGHAVGVTAATIVLGPWGAILATSIALAIQALFFGDGGITTLGANCFNMAIVGAFVAYVAYRLVSGSSDLNSRRRVIAAAIAGYLSINASAFMAAVEFGIQPMLFHDASGTPLYAPYPLRIAIPAMMIGHLTLAGFAEAFIAGGMVSYLQKVNPGLLRGLAGLQQGKTEFRVPANTGIRNLWLTVALLMMVTPLGILAVGTAWGEWSPVDFSSLQARAQMAAVSHGQAPPEAIPSGLRKLSSFWTAPFPDYAPAFVKSPHLGYLLSAMFGVGLVGLLSLIASVAAKKRNRRELGP